MDSQDQRVGAVSRLVSTLRRITRLVQLAPFVYLCLYIAYLLLCDFVTERLVGFADAAVCVSSAVSVFMLVLSSLLQLCSWHKIACLLPYIPKLESYIDEFLFQFTQNEILFMHIATMVLFAVFLFVSFKHFFR